MSSVACFAFRVETAYCPQFCAALLCCRMDMRKGSGGELAACPRAASRAGCSPPMPGCHCACRLLVAAPPLTLPPPLTHACPAAHRPAQV